MYYITVITITIENNDYKLDKLCELEVKKSFIIINYARLLLIKKKPWHYSQTGWEKQRH